MLLVILKAIAFTVIIFKAAALMRICRSFLGLCAHQ